MAVQIVTDSTADLPQELVQRLGITVVPLNLHFGTQVYRDGVDIQAEEFYRRLVTANPLPTTSQPAVGAFVECYEALADGGEPVVSIHIASKLSGTINSALQARQQVGDSMSIEVVDSQTASLGLGLIVLAAAEAAGGGASLEEVLHVTREAVARTRVFFMVDTLEYLQRGGRIGKGQAFLGSVLNIKPILEIHQGEVLPVERVRTRSKALQRLSSLVDALGPAASLAVAYSTASEEAHALAQRLLPHVPADKRHVMRIGPVIGVHAGPGCVGVGVVCQGDKGAAEFTLSEAEGSATP